MNPADWRNLHREPGRHLDPKQWAGVENYTTYESDTYRDHSTYTPEEAHISMGGGNVESNHYVPAPPHGYSAIPNACSSDSATDPDGDPDGEPTEESDVDQELARKLKELQDIEAQIMLKKAAIAIKKLEPSSESYQLYRTLKEKCEEVSRRKSDVSTKNNEPVLQFVEQEEEDRFQKHQKAACDSRHFRRRATLRDRVDVILQQKRPLMLFPKLDRHPPDLPDSLLQSASLRKEGVWQQDHPLKLRIKALMRKRCTRNREVPDPVPSQPLNQNPASAAPEENVAATGLQRFLRVLNKGVDINLLTRIVNDDSEVLPAVEEPRNVQHSIMENNANVPFRSGSQGPHSMAVEQHCSRPSNPETRTDLQSPGGSPEKRHSLPADNDRSRSPCGFSSSSSCLLEKKAKLDYQQGLLQNILRTVGLSLGEEDLSKLADRTQERLYGKQKDDIPVVNDMGGRERDH